MAAVTNPQESHYQKGKNEMPRKSKMLPILLSSVSTSKARGTCSQLSNYVIQPTGIFQVIDQGKLSYIKDYQFTSHFDFPGTHTLESTTSNIL